MTAGRVLEVLAAEGEALNAVVAGVDLSTPTPAPGWTIAHQVAHLAWTDELSLLALTAPERFTERVHEDVDMDVDEAASRGAVLPADELLTSWRSGRAGLLDALAGAPADRAVPWIGPPMKPLTMATARVMETWAHGVDVTDALGRPPREGAVLEQVAHLGVRTRGYAFALHGLVVPPPVRVELTHPGGTWAAGPADAAERVAGPLLDFCLRVVRRRPRDELALVAVGDGADRWLDVAQAYAGAPRRLPAPASVTGLP